MQYNNKYFLYKNKIECLSQKTIALLKYNKDCDEIIFELKDKYIKFFSHLEKKNIYPLIKNHLYDENLK
jgi:hypothetical protein